MRLLPLALIGAATVSTSAIAQDIPVPAYPETRTVDVVERLFGEQIADPYRWLEEDVRNSEEVADWVARQNAVTDAYLAQLPERGWFTDKLSRLLDYERFGTPYRKGNLVFYSYNPGLADQDVLMVKPAGGVVLDDEGKVLLDPNTWSEDGTIALGGWSPSKNAKVLAYAIQEAGSDWRRIEFLDLATGEKLDDTIVWTKNSSVSWVDDQSFFYVRYPEPAEGEDFQARAQNPMVYRHNLGEPQSADELVFATPDQPDLLHGIGTSKDGRLLFILSSDGSGTGNHLRIRSLADLTRDPVIVSDSMEHEWNVLGSHGDMVWLVTNHDAPLRRMVKLDMATAEMVTIVAEAEDNLEDVEILGDRIVANYLHDVKSQLKLFTLDGVPAGEVALPGIGSVGGMSGEIGEEDAWFTFSSFNRPADVFKLDLASGQTHSVVDRALGFDPESIKVEQVFYTSPDGTRVPMFIVRRADSTGPAPTLLYAYGGFGVTMNPAYSSTRMAWIQAGGTYALANIRGGNEYGTAWHDAARGPKRENAFADFIAAGEWLKANGITGPEQLAIMGGSNGGLLMGVVTNRRPDLFDAVVPQVGVMDMLRFDRWGYGRSWAVDYGYPDREEDFRVLRAYSPYHNIRDGVDYPAMLVTTADTDDRVIPGHSFKYISAVQAAELGDEPHLIRIETKAGHGAGTPISKTIEEYSDILGFIAHHTGLEPRAAE